MTIWERIVAVIIIAVTLTITHMAVYKIGYKEGYAVAQVEVRKNLWCKWFKYIFPQSDLKKEDCN